MSEREKRSNFKNKTHINTQLKRKQARKRDRITKPDKESQVRSWQAITTTTTMAFGYLKPI